MKNNQEQARNPLFETETENNITIEIQEQKHNFIIVYDTIYKNSDLTPNEIALLIFYLSRSPNFKTNKNGTMKILKMSRYTYQNTIKKLQEKGYLKIDRKGKNYNYIVNQSPQLTDAQLSYEYLRKNHTFDAQLWTTLLNNKKISYETYVKLLDNLKKIATIKWIGKEL